MIPTPNVNSLRHLNSPENAFTPNSQEAVASTRGRLSATGLNQCSLPRGGIELQDNELQGLGFRGLGNLSYLV